MATVYGFNQERDVNRVLSMLDSFERSKGKSVTAPSSVRQEARYAKILTLLNNSGDEDNDNKEATGVEVAWNKDAYDFAEIPDKDNPVKYNDELLKGDEATVFSTNNIVSKSAMAVDDIVLLQKYPHLSDTAGWLVVKTGGGSRSYVIITAQVPVEDEEGEPIEGEFEGDSYTGDLLGGPNDLTVKKADISIKVPGATSNPFAVGYTDFADVVDDVYYLDGTLLG